VIKFHIHPISVVLEPKVSTYLTQRELPKADSV